MASKKTERRWVIVSNKFVNAEKARLELDGFRVRKHYLESGSIMLVGERLIKQSP
jgi:hypothetical protein